MRSLLPFGMLLALFACATPPPPLQVDAELRADVEAMLRELGPNVQAGLWLGQPGQPAMLELGAETPLPVASAVKAAFLIELFGAFPDRLDEPMPGLDAVLADQDHLALAHFTPQLRDEARTALRGATVRRLGEAMITGKGVSNPTYNIAANLVIAHFGGPRAFTARLHARTESAKGLLVRRYMLADRTADGDNTATAAALAGTHAMMAQNEVPGIDPRAVAAAREVLATADDGEWRTFHKGGALDSDPVTRVEAGWHEGPRGAVVHVVMVAQTGVPMAQREVAGKQLARTAKAIEQRLVQGLRKAP